MIILAAYPNCTATNGFLSTPLADLSIFLKMLAPPGVGLHLLPFSPSTGDWGFAPEDRFTVRPEFGTWGDIQRLAEQRRLIVDGIYNHVGLGHIFAQSFFDSSDSRTDLIYAFPDNDVLDGPRSPRGGSVLRPHIVQGRRWHVWQTFSDSVVDIRLDNPMVRQEIDRHLKLLADQGVWGIRLDALVYFGKELGQNQRHHPDAYRLAREIADLALAHNLKVIAQVDCDAHGLRYFPKQMGYDVPVVDYSYSAYMAHALLGGNPTAFAGHLERTWNVHHILIRAPRTHDGILLRSSNLSEKVTAGIVQKAAKYNIDTRVIDGSPYELNCSFPYLCSAGVDKASLRRRIELAISVTAFVPGWCYLYLPSIVGYVPEIDHFSNEDPRSLNRQPMPLSVMNDFLTSAGCESMYSLLVWLLSLRDEFGVKETLNMTHDTVSIPMQGVLSLRRSNVRLQLLANFNCHSNADVTGLVSGQWIGGRQSGQNSISPLGFGVWRG